MAGFQITNPLSILSAYSTFAQQQLDANCGDAVGRLNLMGTVISISKAPDDGVGRFWRSALRGADNARIRQNFLGAILDVYGMKSIRNLPQHLQDVLTNFGQHTDRPLTARRIAIILSHVAADNLGNKGWKATAAVESKMNISRQTDENQLTFLKNALNKGVGELQNHIKNFAFLAPKGCGYAAKLLQTPFNADSHENCPALRHGLEVHIDKLDQKIQEFIAQNRLRGTADAAVLKGFVKCLNRIRKKLDDLDERIDDILPEEDDPQEAIEGLSQQQPAVEEHQPQRQGIEEHQPQQQGIEEHQPPQQGIEEHQPPQQPAIEEQPQPKEETKPPQNIDDSILGGDSNQEKLNQEIINQIVLEPANKEPVVNESKINEAPVVNESKINEAPVVNESKINEVPVVNESKINEVPVVGKLKNITSTLGESLIDKPFVAKKNLIPPDPKNLKTDLDYLKHVLLTGQTTKCSGHYGFFTRSKYMTRLGAAALKLRHELYRFLNDDVKSGVCRTVSMLGHTFELALDAKGELLVTIRNNKTHQNIVSREKLVDYNGAPLTPKALLQAIEADMKLPQAVDVFQSGKNLTRLIEEQRSILLANRDNAEATAFTFDVCLAALERKVGQSLLKNIPLKDFPVLYICQLTEDVLAGKLTAKDLLEKVNAGNPKRFYPENISKMVSGTVPNLSAVTIDDPHPEWNEDQRNQAEVRDFVADLISSSNGWIYDDPAFADNELARLKNVVARHPKALKLIAQKPELLAELPCPSEQMRAAIKNLVDKLQSGGEVTQADWHDFTAACGTYGSSLENQLVDIFTQATQDQPVKDRFGKVIETDGQVTMKKGPLANTHGRFLARALGIYFKSLDARDRNLMIAAAFRYAKNEKEILGAFLKGAGPVLQKFLQGLPPDFKVPGLGNALEEMKSRLEPIGTEFVQARLAQVVTDSQTHAKELGPDRTITGIAVKKIFGCATIAETVLCNVTYASGKTEEVVLKIRRPEAKNRAIREMDVFLAALSEFPGLKNNVRGQIDQIMTELDFRREAQNIEDCLGVYATDKLDDEHVTMNKLVNGFGRSEDILAITKAEGESVDRFLLGVKKDVTDALKDYVRIDSEGWPKFNNRSNQIMFAGNGKVSTWLHLDELQDKLVALQNKLLPCYNLMLTFGKAWMQEACFGDGVMQYDPHLGNFIFHLKGDKGAGRLCAVDFGNVGKNGSYQKDYLVLTTLASTSEPTHFLRYLIGNNVEKKSVEERIIQRLICEQELKAIANQEQKVADLVNQQTGLENQIAQFKADHPDLYAEISDFLKEDGTSVSDLDKMVAREISPDIVEIKEAETLRDAYNDICYFGEMLTAPDEYIADRRRQYPNLKSTDEEIKQSWRRRIIDGVQVLKTCRERLKAWQAVTANDAKVLSPEELKKAQTKNPLDLTWLYEITEENLSDEDLLKKLRDAPPMGKIALVEDVRNSLQAQYDANERKRTLVSDYKYLAIDLAKIPDKKAEAEKELDRLKKSFKQSGDDLKANREFEAARIKAEAGGDQELAEILQKEYDEVYQREQEAVVEICRLLGNERTPMTKKLEGAMQLLRDVGYPLPQPLFNISQAIGRLEGSMNALGYQLRDISALYDLIRTSVATVKLDGDSCYDPTAMANYILGDKSIGDTEKLYRLGRTLSQYSLETEDWKKKIVKELLQRFTNDSFKPGPNGEISISPDSLSQNSRPEGFFENIGSMVKKNPEIGKLYNTCIVQKEPFTKANYPDPERAYGQAVLEFCQNAADVLQKQAEDLVHGFAKPLAPDAKLPVDACLFIDAKGDRYAFGPEEFGNLKAQIHPSPKQTAPSKMPTFKDYGEALEDVFSDNLAKALGMVIKMSFSVDARIKNALMDKYNLTMSGIISSIKDYAKSKGNKAT